MEVKYVRAFEEFQFDFSLHKFEAGLPEEVNSVAFRNDFPALVDALLKYHGINVIQWEARNSFGDGIDAEDALTPKSEYLKEFAMV